MRNSRQGFRCQVCRRACPSWGAYQRHLHDFNHWSNQCNRCPRTFPSTEALHEHEVSRHYYCRECRRGFTNSSAIKTHLRSARHRGRRTSCPFCQRGYASATGVANHLESGSCPYARGLNRDQTYRFVRDKDPHGVITKKLIGWEGTIEYGVSENCWNGRAYQCYLCHGEFKSHVGLRQHVNSPRHQLALYHCPNRTCGRHFTTIAALFSHLESECCGYTSFEHVQRQVGEFFQSNRILRH